VSDVTVYHPGTGAQAVVPEEALPHLRVSGWLTLDEHNANQAEAEARQAAASKTAAKEK
jgi:hypothetical protein